MLNIKARVPYATTAPPRTVFSRFSFAHKSSPLKHRKKMKGESRNPMIAFGMNREKFTGLLSLNGVTFFDLPDPLGVYIRFTYRELAKFDSSWKDTGWLTRLP